MNFNDSHLVLKGQRRTELPELTPAQKAAISFVDLSNNHITVAPRRLTRSRSRASRPSPR